MNRTVEVRMPQLGESVDAGTITRWLKAAGERVAPGEPLYEVTSDKATMEVPSLTAGFVSEIVAAEGASVAVGAVVARIAAERERLSPVVRRLLREHGLPSGAVAGTAENGRVTKHDVLAHVAARPAAASQPASAQSVIGQPASAQSAIGQPAIGLPAIAQPAEAQDAAAEAAQPALGAVAERSERRTVPLSPLRLRAGARLAAAQKNAVNVFSAIEIDFEAVAAERARRKLTYLPFTARAVVDALGAYPVLNASLDDAASALILHDEIHLGIAVDLDETGLVVPVVRNAGRLSLDGLAAELARLAAGARGSTLLPQDYAGATFTISNNGAFGTLLTAPVINAPNVAIVSTDAVELRPVIVDRAIAIRHRMYFCMTWDHRAFDGSTAARFLARVKANIETWDWAAQ